MANMAALQPATGSRIELDKRQNVPYRVIDNCPACGKQHTIDLSKGDHYLSCPVVGKPEEVYFCCKKCDHEWQVMVVVKITLELVP